MKQITTIVSPSSFYVACPSGKEGVYIRLIFCNFSLHSPVLSLMMVKIRLREVFIKTHAPHTLPSECRPSYIQSHPACVMTNFGHITQRQEVIQYSCSNCGSILAETETPIDYNIILRCSLEEVCPSCGDSLHQKIIIKDDERRAAAAPPWQQQQEQHHTSSSLQVKLETAYDILQPCRLSFDITPIDKCLDLTDRGSGGSGSLCITSSIKDGGCCWQQHINNLLLTRLCVKALMSKRQGGFESPSVIFIDAGNSSDIYQCVNFARQYGLDIQKVLDSIIVSRPFNIHQLAGLLINELDPAVVTQRFGAKLVVISDLLKTLVQDSQIDSEEARWLVKEIARSIRKLASHVLVIISLYECPPQYHRSLLSLFNNQIHIAVAAMEPRHFQVKVSCKNNLFHHHSNSGKKLFSSSSFIMTERDFKIIPAR